MSLNYANSTVSTKNNVPVINWALFNNRANTDSAIPSEPAVGQCVFAKYYSSLNAGAPSFLLIPSRFKSGELYAQIPTNGNGDLNVTRSLNGATRVNSSGLIESVASGIPRFDYFASNGTVGCPALLVEPSGTNLCLQSENFSTTWSPTNVSISGNVTGTTDPAGGNTADQIFETAASGTHFLEQTMTIVSGTTYVGSVFLKKAAVSPDWMQVAFSTTGLAGFANFNLTSGTVGLTGVGCTGRIENYGNGWYRCTLIQTANASGTSGGPVIVFTNNTNSATRFVSYAGNAATSIYVWGAQLETGSVATSYIPTAAASGSRSADVISVSGAVSGSIGQTEGTIYMEVDIRNLARETYLLRIDEGAAANVLSLRKLDTNLIRSTITAPTTSGTLNISSAAFTAGIVKIAFAYKSGEIALSVNGATALTTNGTFSFGASLSRVSLGSNVSAGSEFNARIRAAALYDTRLTNAELATLTTP